MKRSLIGRSKLSSSKRFTREQMANGLARLIGIDDDMKDSIENRAQIRNKNAKRATKN